MGRLLLLLAFASIAGLWLFSHIAPTHFGSCRDVPLNFGSTPDLVDCSPYSTSDFSIPLAIVVAVALLAGGDDDTVRFSIPGVGTFEKTREGKKAARGFRKSQPELDKRADAWLDVVDVTLEQVRGGQYPDTPEG